VTGRHELGRHYAVWVADVPHPDRPVDRVPVGRGRDPADQNAIPPDRLVVMEERGRVIEGEAGQPPPNARFLLTKKGLATNPPTRFVRVVSVDPTKRRSSWRAEERSPTSTSTCRRSIRPRPLFRAVS
jgi:hypothetical protein